MTAATRTPIVFALPGLLIATLALGCGRKAPSGVRAVITAQRPVAVLVAEQAARICPAAKTGAPFQKNPLDAPPPPASPANGSSLEEEPRVVEVRVTCSWPDPRDPTKRMWSGTTLPSLRWTPTPPVRLVNMPEDLIEDSCKGKDNAHNCEQVRTPSRYAATDRSADLRVVRPTLDGGEAEVLVVIAVP